MKILVLKVSAIGDVIHTLPAVFYLKKCYPNAQISWVVQKKAADLILNQPFLDEVFVLPDKFLQPKNWLTTFKILKKLRRTKWDAIIDFQGIHKTSLLISWLRGKKFGFDAKLARSRFSTLFTHEQASFEFKNIIQKNLGLVSHVTQALSDANGLCTTQCPSIAALKKTFDFKFDQAGIDAVEEWLATSGLNIPAHKKSKLILLCPNTTREIKHWPEEYWVEFINQLSHQSSEYKILIVGQKFGKAAKQIAQSCKDQKLPVHIVPAWDLNATAYLISKADLLIAPDTGLLHLADFLNITTIGIFGPTNKDIQGPFLKDINIKNAIQVHNNQVNNDMNESKCQKATAYQNNMYKLKPSVLLEKVLQLLENQN